MLFGITCRHDLKPSGEIFHPLVNVVAKDSSMLRISHYSSENGVGARYSYFLKELNKNALTIINERNYKIGTKKITGVRHVYVRRKV